MLTQEIKEQIAQYLDQLPEEQLHRLANFAAQLVKENQQKQQEVRQKLIRSLRGKYAHALSGSESFAQNKQEEIELENRNQ